MTSCTHAVGRTRRSGRQCAADGRRLSPCSGAAARMARQDRGRADLQHQSPSVFGQLYMPARSRSEEPTPELQSLMRISYAVFRLKKKDNTNEEKRNHNDIVD